MKKDAVGTLVNTVRVIFPQGKLLVAVVLHISSQKQPIGIFHLTPVLKLLEICKENTGDKVLLLVKVDELSQ